MYLDGITEGISNIRVGDNPLFTVENFLEVYPQFGINTTTNTYNVPEMVIQMYLEMADSRIKESRWHKSWKIGMCLFIAHYCTLYLQTVSTPEDGQQVIASAGQIQGLQTSMSADGVSIGKDYSTIVKSEENANDFNLTTFGIQFLSLAKLFGRGGFTVL